MDVRAVFYHPLRQDDMTMQVCVHMHMSVLFCACGPMGPCPLCVCVSVAGADARLRPGALRGHRDNRAEDGEGETERDREGQGENERMAQPFSLSSDGMSELLMKGMETH